MNPIIQVQHLVKRYGDLTAVRDLSFQVEEGSLFAFLGTNGAGKSTTIHILTTLIRADSGDVSVMGYVPGKDDVEIRKGIGSVFQQGVLDDRLTVYENLVVRGSFYGLSREALRTRIEEVSRFTGCDGYLHRWYGRLSGGEKRRADIARALIHRPKLLFLDEPTTALDPGSRRAIRDAIFAMKERFGMTIFLTTHYMEEAASADHVVILKKGDKVADATPAELKARYAEDRILIYNADPAVTTYLDEQQLSYRFAPPVLEIRMDSVRDTLTILNTVAERYSMSSFEVIHGTLDDVFLRIMGQEGSNHDGHLGETPSQDVL